MLLSVRNGKISYLFTFFSCNDDRLPPGRNKNIPCLNHGKITYKLYVQIAGRPISKSWISAISENLHYLQSMIKHVSFRICRCSC